MIRLAPPSEPYPPSWNHLFWGFDLTYGLPSTPIQTVSPPPTWVVLELTKFGFELTYGLPSTPKLTVSHLTWIVLSSPTWIFWSSHTICIALPCKPYPPLDCSELPRFAFALTYDLHSTPLQTVYLNLGCLELSKFYLSSHTICTALPCKPYPTSWISFLFCSAHTI